MKRNPAKSFGPQLKTGALRLSARGKRTTAQGGAAQPQIAFIILAMLLCSRVAFSTSAAMRFNVCIKHFLAIIVR